MSVKQTPQWALSPACSDVSPGFSVKFVVSFRRQSFGDWTCAYHMFPLVLLVRCCCCHPLLPSIAALASLVNRVKRPRLNMFKRSSPSARWCLPSKWSGWLINNPATNSTSVFKLMIKVQTNICWLRCVLSLCQYLISFSPLLRVGETLHARC